MPPNGALSFKSAPLPCRYLCNIARCLAVRIALRLARGMGQLQSHGKGRQVTRHRQQRLFEQVRGKRPSLHMVLSCPCSTRETAIDRPSTNWETCGCNTNGSRSVECAPPSTGTDKTARQAFVRQATGGMLAILAVASPWRQTAVLDGEWDEQDEQERNRDSTRTHALLCSTDACMTMSICGAT